MCGGGCCPDPVFVPEPQKFLNTISACGNWCHPCGEQFPRDLRVLWQKDAAFTGTIGGTVTINYQGGCDNVLGVVVRDSRGNIYGGNEGSFSVPRAVGACLTERTGNTVSRMFPDIASVEVFCQGTPATNCFGKYCLDLYNVVTAP